MDELVSFFNERAENWDDCLRPHDHEVGRAVLARLDVGPADRVLDVACGTGVLQAPLRERGVSDITAVDVSPGMAEVFKRKFPEVKCVTADYHKFGLFPDGMFTKVMIYNAFPHFSEPAAVVANAARQLRPGGRLLIAHSLNRSALALKHKEAGGVVGEHALPADWDIAAMLFSAGFRWVVIEDKEYFFVSAGK